MTTRVQLEEILAAQRARTQRVHSPASRVRGRNLVGALAVIAILAASGAAMFLAVKMTTPKTAGTATATATTSSSASPSAYAVSSSTTFPATPVVMRVCTAVPDGRLHVRFAAGAGEVRGYLVEGESVLVVLAADNESDSQMTQGELWLRISAPVAGWVNAHYLCKKED